MSSTHSSSEKGIALERAVHAIESAILKHNPSLKENAFKIENRKIVISQGVRHEIDLHVVADLAKGYRAIFIFECKNWEKKVGKNDIIVFSEKIDAANAQNGFFVARSFTSDARAQAKKDARVQLLVAKQFTETVLPAPFEGFHHISRDRKKMVPIVDFIPRIPQGFEQRQSVETATAVAVHAGEQIDLGEYIRKWCDDVSSADVLTFPSGGMPDGTYKKSVQDLREFSTNEFVLNGIDISALKLKLTQEIQIIRTPVISHFEVKTRGRVIEFAPAKIPGLGSVRVSFVTENASS